MNLTTKSLIRHLLTALGTILVLLGLNGAIPVIDFLKESLDTVWGSIVTIIGFITTLYGFLKDRERLKDTGEAN